MTTFRMHARGPFSLAEAARFQESFPAGQGGGDRARLDLAFPAEGPWSTVGVRVTEDDEGLRGEVVANPGRLPVDEIRTQVERILSLDVDGTGFTEVGERDPVVGDLQRRFPGLRPVLFPSPYEAAAWALIGHRIRMTQAATVKTRLAEELGESVDFGDRSLPAFPPPGRLAELGVTPGLTDLKVENLRALGRATMDGDLDADLLRAMPAEEALAHLQKLPGIGPFSAELVLIRGAGDPDAFATQMQRLHRAMAGAYGLGPDPGAERLRAIADDWRPYRSWVTLLIRNSA
jgi:DNA-3-methyladenine glycosylase II